MIRVINPSPQMRVEMVIESVTAREELAQVARFKRNTAWLRAHADEVYPRNRGKFIRKTMPVT